MGEARAQAVLRPCKALFAAFEFPLIATHGQASAAHLCSIRQHELDHLLRTRLRLFQEEFDRCCYQLQLYVGRLLRKGL